MDSEQMTLSEAFAKLFAEVFEALLGLSVPAFGVILILIGLATFASCHVPNLGLISKKPGRLISRRWIRMVCGMTAGIIVASTGIVVMIWYFFVKAGLAA
ncbi:MAG TPA: hypothetical protein VEC17_00760 [Candidatus Binatia bacterium]|nr:hypothetical protein [Candidatus Binatia bacterium]